ncbi:MAG: nuclease A inhibitor family protein [Cyanobacteria bacterium P01_H01_bin.21]
MPTTQDLLPELEAACEDLLWRSETDYPFEVVVLTAKAHNVQAVIKEDYPGDTPMVLISLDDFFGQSIQERAWFDSRELALVQRYRNLRDLLEATLENLQVYRIGRVEIDVYLVGETEDQQVVGVKTKIVET